MADTRTFAAVLRGFFARGFFSANSKPNFPFSNFKCAEKGRPFFEINFGSRSVLPVALVFAPALWDRHDAKSLCSHGRCTFFGRWRRVRTCRHFPVRKPDPFGKPGKGRSSGVWRSIVTGAPLPPSPKSNSCLKSSPSFTVALNQPSHLAAESFQRAHRALLARSCSTSRSRKRPAIVFQMIKPQTAAFECAIIFVERAARRTSDTSLHHRFEVPG